MKSFVRMIVLCSVLVAGCTQSDSSSSTTSAPSETLTTLEQADTSSGGSSTSTTQPEQTTSTVTSTSTPTTTSTTTTTAPPSGVTEAEINDALVEYLPAELASTNFGGTPFCGHYLYGFDQDGDQVSAYIFAWCLEYYVQDGLMEMGTGMGVEARVELKVTGDGLSAYSHVQPPEGEDYTLVGLFPEWLLEAMPDQRELQIVPDEPLTQAAAYFGAVPERTLPPGATCTDVAAAYPLYVDGVMYWLREGRPAALDVDGDGRPCEDEFASHLVDMYWHPLSVPLEPGLLCRDLDGYGVSLQAAIGYWLAEGRPDRMDADRNGIPCETVYPAEEFAALFSAVADEPPGQYCRDLRASGYWFEDAVVYWLLESMPDRMDADRNGVPCETVYDEMEILPYLQSGFRDIDSGLYCRDLAARSWGFSGAVSYWMNEGMPDRMDADGDGIPCETVYDQFEIDSWIEFDRVWRVG